MGDSGTDTESTAEDFNSLEVTDPGPPSGGDDNQQSRSNIVDSSSYDAQFTANQLESRGLDPQGFMSAENFAQTTQGGAGGDDTTSTAEDFIDSTGISVPTIQAAGTTPTFSGAGVSDVFDPMTMQSRSDTMVEALGAAPTTPEARGTSSTVQSFLPAAVTVDRLAPQTKEERGLQAVANMFAQARDRERNKQALDPSGIDFGVTDAPVPSTVGDDFGPALDMADRSNMANITETALGARTPGTRTTATGTTTGDAQFGVSPGRLQAEFGPRVASLAGGLDAQKTADIADLTNRPGIGTTLGLPGILATGANLIGQKSRDRMAEAIARGRTDPLFGKGIDITEANLIRNDRGQVVGIRDNFGNLIEGMDPNEQTQGDDSPDPQKIVPPKKPTDPCPEGFQLIDGKCTPVGGTETKTDTGFVVFPPSRDPAFRRGPFTPATVASNPGIRGLNPITFNIPQNIFRR